MTYKIKYRLRGQWLWRTIKNVRGDQILFGYVDVDGVGHDPLFRAITTADNDIYYIPLDAEVLFPKERQEIVSKKMGSGIGQQIQMVTE